MKKITMFKSCLLHFIFMVQLHKISSSTIISETNSSEPLEVIDLNNGTLLQPVAEKLIQRHHYHQRPAVKIIKIVRPKRVRHKRVKKPKIKFNFAEPPANTHIYYSSKHNDYAPTIFSDLNWNLPTAADYQDHKLNFEFYNNGGDVYDLEKPVEYEDVDEYRDHAYEANEKYKETLKPTSFSYHVPETTSDLHTPHVTSYFFAEAPQHQASALRKPHIQYGVPGKQEKPSHSVQHHFAEPPSLNFDLPYVHKHGAKPSHKHRKPPPQKYLPTNTPSEQNHDYVPPAPTTPQQTHPSQYEEQQPPQPVQYILASNDHSNGYIPPSNELPITQDDTIAPYGYPKTSYEVPIYDPAPFDLTKQEELEIYPPYVPTQHSAQTQSTHNDAAVNEHDSYSSSSLFNTNESFQYHSTPHYYFRAKERPKTGSQESSPSSSSSTIAKHILDTPELRKAFEQRKRSKFQAIDTDGQSSDSSSSSSSYSSPVLYENFDSEVWNPMKITSLPITPTIPTTVSTAAPFTLANIKNHFRSNYRERTASTDKPALLSTTVNGTKVDILSINKSRSASLHNGILSTPSLAAAAATTNRVYRRLMRGHNNNNNNNVSIVPQQQQKQSRFTDNYKLPKRSTEGVLDTTPFESPFNNNGRFKFQLPLNHKIY